MFLSSCRNGTQTRDSLSSAVWRLFFRWLSAKTKEKQILFGWVHLVQLSVKQLKMAGCVLGVTEAADSADVLVFVTVWCLQSAIEIGWATGATREKEKATGQCWMKMMKMDCLKVS